MVSSAHWRRQWHPTSVLLPGKSMDRGVWWATVHRVTTSWAQLSDFTFTFHFPSLENEMATHSSVLAWRIPETGEPGGLPFMGSHRVGHDWSDLAAAAASVYLRLLIFSWQSWFQLVLHPAQHFTLCTLHIGECNLRLPCLIWKL